MNGSQYIWILHGISFMLTSGALAGHLLKNVALNKNAVQSSVHSPGVAGRAVDGNREQNWQYGSCTMTKMESDPWWRVDLQNVYAILAVLVTNRKAHPSRLNGVEIWIGNSIEANDTKNFRCGVVSSVSSRQTVYIPCGSMEGRYVTVRLRGSKKVLTLCEVEVYSKIIAYPLPNVALKGNAVQSSTLSFANANNAIDARRNSFYSQGSCSHTAVNETNPWWRVDLGRTCVVTVVKVTNRGDCCAERLDGAEIRIGNSLENNGNKNPRCAFISHIKAGKTYTFRCSGGMAGRFVNVIIPGERKTLTLCEVEVYATTFEEPVPNVANMKYTAQSQVALNPGCCDQTSLYSNPWWRVDLGNVHSVKAVTIIKRHNCCPEGLKGAQILIGTSLVPSVKNNSRCVMISSEQDTPIHTVLCDDMSGRYVYVVFPGQLRSVPMCEVQVYAPPTAVKRSSRSLHLLPPPLPPTVSMLLSGRTVTLVAERLCWSDALFYCRRHHWDLLSLRSQEEQSEVEQLLSRRPFPLTDYVWLGLARYITSGRWFWMSGDSVKFTKWPRDPSPHQISSPCGAMATGERHLWEDRPCDELLNFICQSRAEDGAQRVYFYNSQQGLNGLTTLEPFILQ